MRFRLHTAFSSPELTHFNLMGAFNTAFNTDLGAFQLASVPSTRRLFNTRSPRFNCCCTRRFHPGCQIASPHPKERAESRDDPERDVARAGAAVAVGVARLRLVVNDLTRVGGTESGNYGK